MKKKHNLDKLGLRKSNIYPPGSKRYYRDALVNIVAMCVDYDGFRTVKGLKSLIDDVRDHANKALNLESLYVVPKREFRKKGGKDVKD